MFIDARSIAKRSRIDTDICIVGSGAAGITLARELNDQPFKVCLLEAGGFDYEAETQALYQGSSVGFSYFPLEATRLRMFGGTTMHWGGASRPLDPMDFEVRDWVPHSGWPFGYDHLVPFYERAHPVLELGPFVYSSKPLEEKGLRPAKFVSNVLRNDVLQQSPPTQFGVTYREEMRRSRNIDVYLHANVIEIETNPAGKRVSRLRVASLERNDFSVAAKIFILAAGGIENPRLLLHSDRTNPRGIGNSNGLVGRFFMEHPVALWSDAGSIAPLDLSLRYYEDRVPVSMRNQRTPDTTFWGFVTPSPETLRRHKLLNCGIALRRPPVSEAPSITSARDIKDAVVDGKWPDELATHVGNIVRDLDDVALHGVKKITGWESLPDHVEIQYWSEPQPNPDSRIFLSKERDALGQRRSVIDWRLTDQDKQNIRTVLRLFAEELGQAGIGRLRIDPRVDAEDLQPVLTGSYHHMGTTRMHADPRRGVVDANCRMHEVANLYVAGSSVFPAAGHANPMLTIVALAIRLADHLKHLLRTGHSS